MKWNGVLIVGILLVILLGFFVFGVITTEVVDVGGYYSSIALDSNGVVHVATFNLTHSDLRYCNNSGGSWNCVTILDDTGRVLGKTKTDIAIDSLNKAHICYSDYSSSNKGNLTYCNNTAGSWSCVTMTETDGFYCGIAIDSSDKVHISHYEDVNDNLRYCNNTAGSWSCKNIQTSPTGVTGLFTSIAIDSSNLIHVLYQDGISYVYNLGYCNNSGGSWSCNIIDNPSSDSGNYASVAIDSLNILHVSHYDNTNDALRYCNNSGGSWSCINVTFANISYLSLATDSNDYVHISYMDYYLDGLVYCKNTLGSWSCNTLLDEDSDIETNSLAIKKGRLIDSSSFSDYLNIVSRNVTSNNLLYIKYHLDDVYPQISITTPSNNTNSSNTGLDVNYTRSDTNLASCWYSNDTYSLNTTLAGCTNLTTIIWSEGQHNVTIWANDSAGNTNSSSVTFTIDTTPPQISITTPSNNTNSSNTILNVNYTTFDSLGISTCWYSNDTYSLNITLSNCANITSVTWSEGKHNITIWANDTLNNINSSSVTFTIDTIKPNIQITTPSNNTNSSNTGLDVNYTRSDTNLASCWYSNDTYSLNTTLAGCTNLTTIIWSEGQHNVTIWANDSAGNTNSSSVTFTIDTIKPNIQITTPSNNTNSSNTGLDVNYTRSDTNLASCWYSNDTYSLNTTLAGCTNLTTIIWSEGQHNVTIWANDSAGNTNSSSVRFLIDSINPIISYGSVTENNDTNFSRNWIYINVSVTELNEKNITFRIFKDSIETSQTYTDGTRFNNFTGLTNGVYYYNVTIYDSAGNTNSTPTRLIRLDTTAPTITLYDPDPVTYASNESLPLNFSVSDAIVGVSSCWFKVVNESGTIEINNQSLPNCQNTTFNVSKFGLYNFTIWSNDTLNNLGKVELQFEVDLTAPAVVLNYPINYQNLSIKTNVDINFTATDSDGLSTCNLWGNWTGAWHKNYTWISPTNAIMNNTKINFTDGYYVWSVWCNDTFDNGGWALNNLTFTIDTTYPTVSIDSLTTTVGSQAISFNTSASDINLKSCKFSIYNLAGGIDGIYENVSIDCNTNPHSATVSSYATYILKLYALDHAGNENLTNLSFTTSASTGGTILPGSGGTIIQPETNQTELGYCGDNICNRLRGETFYNCPEDCAQLSWNLDSILFGCFDDNDSTECVWETRMGLIVLFALFGIAILFSIFFDYKPKEKGVRKIVYASPFKKKKRRYYP